MRTQVGIVGAGPAGLMLSHLLHLEGIESVVLEARSREYVEQRVRAGVLEQGTVDLLRDTGLGDRLRREGLVHHGIELRFDGRGHRIALSDLTGGRSIFIYGQQEGDVDVTCDVIAGCDGFHGVSREAVPEGSLRSFQHEYPFAWLGVLAAVAPSTDELIYAYHDRGFALHSLRSPQISRLYLQVDPGEDVDDWPDDRIWEELRTRLHADGWTLADGPILEKGITPLRSFVAEPMQYGRLFLAGDAAHIVPATGAKGLNLAVADVRVLAEAIAGWYRTGSTDLLDGYSARCLRRVWRVQEFSSSMSSMLHRFPDDDGFRGRVQRAQLEWISRSEAAARSLAENYVGLPLT